MRLAMIMLALALATTATAAVPGFIPYSGRLTDGAFAGASTTANVRVLLYTCACAPDAALDGTICTDATRCAVGQTGLYFEGLHANVPVVDGYFSLMVGMYDASGVAKPDPGNSALTPKLPLPDRLWITVSVNGMPELSPRQALGSVPYATNAGVSYGLAGNARMNYEVVYGEQMLPLDSANAYCTAAGYQGAVIVPRSYSYSEQFSGNDVIAACKKSLFLWRSASNVWHGYPNYNLDCDKRSNANGFAVYWPWVWFRSGGAQGNTTAWLMVTHVICY